MNHEQLSARLWRFAARVGKVVAALPDTRLGRQVAGQLVRCGTSAPSNYDEGSAAESKPDWPHLAIPDFRFSIFNHASTQTPLLRRRCYELIQI